LVEESGTPQEDEILSRVILKKGKGSWRKSEGAGSTQSAEGMTRNYKKVRNRWKTRVSFNSEALRGTFCVQRKKLTENTTRGGPESRDLEGAAKKKRKMDGEKGPKGRCKKKKKKKGTEGCH